MKLKEKVKYRMLQKLYGKKFNKATSKFLNSVDELDEFIGEVLSDNISSGNKTKGKKRRRI